MFKLIVRYVYSFLALIAVIGGVWAFYDQLVAVDDYGLTLTLKSKEKLIENNHQTPGLTMLYNGVEVNSLFITKIQLKNTGKRALTKDFIYEPVKITLGKSNKILQINTKNLFITHSINSITFKWNLFNPNEIIEIVVFSTQPVTINMNHKIKEITTIAYIDEIINPPTEQKLKAISIFWFLLMVIAILLTLDAVSLIKNDKKLGKIFVFLRSLPDRNSIQKEAFLSELLNLYQDYYRSVPILFVKPDELIKLVSENITQSEIITGHELYKAKQEGINYVRHLNLYSIRTINIMGGPLLFIFSFIRILLALF
ncbi:MAG: hypothetical protein JU82_11680 [Sulfuricurvum sp. MLSB]|uniref:hypothetical protein n=1 Tax=unclassified Sulfuricurvum TaxID=2632390 RepID=UPI0005023AD5|nr:MULTISPECIES: hypothetical protein [unclassified Sulfuricurvum]KFN38481.1 MAG: hypothetical protein JU82_11680 [Sulfuricurvum sp. MLSB]